MKIDILAFGAHPDDVELGCGGTLHKAVINGKTVGIIDLTKGELGTRGDIKTRELEATNAAKVLGASFRKNLGMSDGFLTNSKENQLLIIENIRKYQPEIVFCNSFEDRHPDHSKACQLVRESCFLSGLVKIMTKDKDGNSQKFWRPNSVYSYIQWKSLKPEFVVDISSSIDIKISAVECYKSQFYNPSSDEINTPISTKNFIKSVRYRAADLGRLTNLGYAEGFVSDRLIAVDSIFDIK
jgi:bacillithiol biosynthesis deacetylase BshB1